MCVLVNELAVYYQFMLNV